MCPKSCWDWSFLFPMVVVPMWITVQHKPYLSQSNSAGHRIIGLYLTTQTKNKTRNNRFNVNRMSTQ